VSGPARIPLVGKRGAGLFALVDPEQLERLQQHRWYLDRHGYVYTHLEPSGGVPNRKWMHHMVFDERGKGFVDHINSDPLDNRIQNLRPATAVENNRNRRVFARNKTGFKGVTCRGPRSYQVNIHDGKTQIRIGTFPHVLLAAFAYNCAAVARFGAFAHLNLLPENWLAQVGQDLNSSQQVAS
jgi:hypothetical protein